MDKQRVRKQLICVLTIGLLFFSAFVRFVRLGTLPYGVNGDEAMSAVEALALSNYGTDRFGTPFPVHFRAWSVGQMSVLLAYLQSICISIFGFSTFSIRIPAMILSMCGIIAVFVFFRVFVDNRMALLALFMVSISPWHFIQSRWALDCNMFPHIFLVGFCLLIIGAEKRKNIVIFLSMIFFGLTFYCYGIAAYSVPLFLLCLSIYLVKKKYISFSKVFISAVIFFVIALPEMLVLAINAFEWDTIHTPLITMEFFPESVRKNDILFFSFSIKQLISNVQSVFRVLILQPSEGWYNNVPLYGSVYLPTCVFAVWGLVCSVKKLINEKSLFCFGHLMFFMTGLWIGVVTNNVNVNRLNLIFYPWLMYAAYGIYNFKSVCVWVINKFTKNESAKSILSNVAYMAVILGYVFMATFFFRLYFLKYETLAGDSNFNSSYVKAIEEVDSSGEYDVLYISAFNGYGAYIPTTEILTNFASKHDALYLQGKSCSTNGRELLPYSERYHYFYSWETDERQMLSQSSEYEGVVLLVHVSELEYIDCDYCIEKSIGDYRILRVADIKNM